MHSVFGRLTNIAFIKRHYRGIVFGLVLVNTALIVFLVVYIWTYGLEPNNTRSFVTEKLTAEKPPGHFITGTTTVDKLVVWSKAGGMAKGGQSRGAIDGGKSVKILGSVEIDSGLWLEVAYGQLTGWVPASGVRSARLTH